MRILGLARLCQKTLEALTHKRARRHQEPLLGRSSRFRTELSLSLLLVSFLMLLGGCGQQPVSFSSNAVFAAKLEQELGQPMDRAEQDIQAILLDSFGTPDAPLLPAAITEDESLAGLIDPARLVRAAGAVSSDREGAHVGLYREHCSTCHGISGDGRGPTALYQNPYPRDYRSGTFKYKSTPRGSKPTRQDLARTVLHGLPGTAMPAFELLAEEGNEEDIEALLDYVIYLSIRGELERRLMITAATEFDYDSDSDPADKLLRPSDQERHPEEYAEQAEWIASEIHQIANPWATAEAEVPTIPAPPVRLQPSPQPRVSRAETAGDASTLASARSAAGEFDASELRRSIAMGRELFHGQIANCSTCHGVDGAGGVPIADYDDWTKEWTTQLGIDPEDREKLKPFLEAGALPPRPLPARRLTLGGFRGGDSLQDIYLRIVHGIDGTPMPAINLVESESGTGLTSDQVWHLVHYVLSLSDLSTDARSVGAPASSRPTEPGAIR